MFNICPNAYYNYLKNRKADYHQQKDEIEKSIREIYHSHGGLMVTEPYMHILFVKDTMLAA